MTILKVDHVQKAFNGKTVLRDVSFQINQGEIVGVIGQNGAGKSTLIKLINRLLPANQGTVTYFGQNKLKRGQIGVMSQHSLVIPRVTVAEMIKLTQDYFYRPLTYQQILSLSGLTDFQKSKVSQLSGGQRQRLSFALAMAGDPQLIFLDEPTVGMDVNSRREFWNLVRTFKDQGKAFVITNHYLQEIEDYADRLLILHQGLIQFDGTLAQLRDQHHETTVSFVSDLPATVIQDLPGISNLMIDGNKVSFTTPEMTPIYQFIDQYHDQIKRLNISDGSLESLFVQLTDDHKEVHHE